MQQYDILEEAVRDLARMGEGQLNHHPDPAVLVDYIDDLLSEAEMDLIREHLSICRQCTQSVLNLQDGILLHPHSERPDPERAGRPERPFWKSPTMLWALAASLLLAESLVIMWYALKLKEHEHEMSQQIKLALEMEHKLAEQRELVAQVRLPSVNHLIELSPKEAHEKGNVPEILTAPAGQPLTLLLNTVDLQEKGPFQLRLDRGTDQPWISEASPTADGYLSLNIPAQSPGRYSIVLIDPAGETKATYEWIVK